MAGLMLMCISIRAKSATFWNFYAKEEISDEKDFLTVGYNNRQCLFQ